MVAMNTLTSYLKAAGQTQAQFAAAVGIDQATVSKLCRGKLVPSLPLAAAIERATGGRVAMASWLIGAPADFDRGCAATVGINGAAS